jgi:hypothetical protein
MRKAHEKQNCDGSIAKKFPETGLNVARIRAQSVSRFRGSGLNVSRPRPAPRLSVEETAP